MSTTTAQRPALLTSLKKLADDVGRKTAESPYPSDPGFRGGTSSHPSANVDNGAQAADMGSIGKEQSSDLKAAIGKPNVDAMPEQTDRQTEVQPQIGITQSDLGGDPSVEDNYGNAPQDPGSEHPARVDNEELDGRKYAALTIKQAQQRGSALANAILADIATGRRIDRTKTSAELPGQPTAAAQQLDALIKQAAASAKAAAAPAASEPSPEEAMRAGYELAAQLGLQQKAAEDLVTQEIAGLIKEAHNAADSVAAYIYAARKQALAVGGGDESHTGPAGDGSGKGDMDGGGGGSPAADDAPLLGAGGPGPEDPATIEELSAALEEAGIPPEALIAALTEQAGGAPPEAGGAPPDAGGVPLEAALGGAPPEAPPEGGSLAKMAAAVVRYRQTGRGHKLAVDGSPQRLFRDEIKSLLRESLQR